MKTTPIPPRRSLFKTYQPTPVNSSNFPDTQNEGPGDKVLYKATHTFLCRHLAFIYLMIMICFGFSALNNTLSAQCDPCVPGMVNNDNGDPWSSECYLSATCAEQGNPCQANDVRLTGVFIADSMGNPVAACTIGDSVAALLWGNFTNNTGTDRYAIRTNTEVWINGSCNVELNSCSFDLLVSGATAAALVGSFNYVCGDQIQLVNTWIGWNTSASQCSDPGGSNYNDVCGEYSPSKCSKELGAIDFLAPNFSFTCGEVTSTTTEVCFTDLTIGGTPPYTWDWDFGDGGMSTVQNPCHTYNATTGMFNVTLIVTDADGTSAGAILAINLDSLNCCELIITCPPANGGTFSCITSIPAADTSLVNVIDSCGPITITVQENSTGTGCKLDTFRLTRKYIVSDGIFMDTCTQLFKATDDQPPALTCPSAVTVQCANQVPAPNTASVTSTDNCTGISTITHVGDVMSNLTCANRFTITRTYRATDACGNSATCSQTIAVFDNTPPALTCPAPVLVPCASQVPAPNVALVTSTDNCGGSTTVTFVGDVMSNQTCINRFTLTRTYRATDACGNSATCTQIISVFDNTTPSITCPANLTVSCLNQVPTPNPSIVTSSDNCGGTSTITFVNDDLSNGVCANRFTLTRTYRATDACGNSATCTQIITVFDNTPPSITCPANVTVSCANQVPMPNTTSVTSSDNCGGSPSIIHVGDVISNMACANRFNVTRTYRAIDACGNSASCTQTITVFDNTAPSITCPANVTVQCANQVPAPNIALVTSTDNCGGTATVTHVGDAVSNQTCINRFNVTRTYRAMDECGNSATCTQTITVFDNTAPSITCPADVTVSCANLVPPVNTGSITGSDNCGGAVIVGFLGDVTVNLTCTNRFKINRTYQASDLCGNTATCIQMITVFDNIPPTLTCPANVTVSCASQVPPAVPGTISTTDNCVGTVTVTSNDVISNMACTNRLTITRTYRASDNCGNSSSCTQVITVFDDSPPSITCPADVTVSCANLVPPVNTAGVTSSDNCGGTPTVTHLGDMMSNQTCVNRFILTRTYRATDACGNSATCTQVITVNDIIPPQLTCPPNTTISNTEDTSPDNTGTATSTDNCGGTPSITNNDVTLTGECEGDYSIERTWTATDECGNSSTCLQIVVVDRACNVDLALVKNLDAGQNPISGGDNVNFTITVTNEGLLAVGSVTIIDYIPLGFSLNDPDWVAGTDGSTGQSATITLSIGNGALSPGGLMPGQMVSVGITLQADLDIASGFYINIGEITTVFDVSGNNVTNSDIDSDPDTNDTNDPEAEDDHDPVAICVISPTVILGDNFVCIDDTITYEVEDFNSTHTYIWSLPDGGGVIIENNDSSIVVHWVAPAGGPYRVSVIDIAGPDCQSSGSIEVFIQGGEPIACHTQVNISLDNECGTVVVSGMILTGDQADIDNYEVFLIDQNGDTIPNATLTCEHIGLTLIASVKSQCSGQSCWGYITVEDKMPPIIDCICPINNEDTLCNVTCRQIQQMIAGDIPEELRADVIDNCCGTTTLEIINIDVQFDNCGGGFVRVTWEATDASGNISTCEQQFNIIPLTLETLTFPKDYEGVCHGSSDPSVTGWPQVDGIDLDLPAGMCNLYVTYSDLLIHLCGGGTKIIRTWTVRDWCTGEISVFSQAIFLADHQGPVLTCIDDFTIGTSVWYCYANVVVPRPNAVDACSRITNYHLFSPEGTVVNVGNNTVINGLPIGTHTVIWTVTDECFNTSTCTIDITVVDDVPPVLSCQAHTIVGLTSERPNGVTLVPADAFDDGSFDNCGPVSFRARRMDSCIDFDWTTGGACVDEIPGGNPPVNGFDLGTERGPCVPFACCDVGAGPIMVELEVRDTSGNVNYCMVEVEVQDKLSPSIECPPDITVSCEFIFNVVEGTFVDLTGNNDGTLDEDPLSELFGNVYDAFRHYESERKNVVIFDPHNTQFHQPHNFGLEGWAKDNCDVRLDVTVRVFDDCSGASFPLQAPQGARKLIERIFRAHDGTNTGSCLQKIWVVDFDPFYITDTTCFDENPNDDVIWPCDVLLSSCPDNLDNTGEPILFDDACSLVGINHDDARFNFADSACYKVLREWQVIDWCQFNPNTGYGLWSYVQTIKVMDAIIPEFLDCPQQAVELCLGDPGISLPANNQIYLGENDPNSSSCSVHVSMSQLIHEACSESIFYDVKIYPFNGSSFIQIKPTTQVSLDANHNVEISFSTQESTILSIQQNGLPYNSPLCNDYHRVLWSIEDGCGNQNSCDYLFRLEDCKDPTPVCIDGLSSVLLGPDGEVTIWASDFNSSSFDDCTPGDELLFSFSGTTYEPSHTYTCDNVPEFDVELPVEIWAADEGSDQNCNGQIEWSERNKDFCITTIVISDNEGVCDQQQNALSGEILTDHNDAVEKVIVSLSSPGQQFPSYTTTGDGKFIFDNLPLGLDYTITPERNDDYKNGVSTLDLVKIQKHLLGNEFFTSPYQYIAADANNTRTVSALDILELRKLILGLYITLPYNDSWRFIDKKFVMIDPTNPWLFDEDLFISHWTGENADHGFVAIKIGDVNNTVKANAQQILPRNEASVMNIRADVKEEARSGEIVEMKLTFPDIVSGFQWTMETDGLEYVGVYSGDIQINDNNVGSLENDITTISWNGDVLSGGTLKHEMSFTLRWKVIVPGKINNRIRCTSLVTPAECYTADGEIHQVKLAYTNSEDSSEFTLYQNKPNPWNGQTTIGFDLPEDTPARLTLFDATGKTIMIVEGEYKAGYNSVTLTSKDLPIPGVIYYRLESGGYSAIKKMVLIR